MTDPIAFVLAALALLAAPGPTNVLLAASGAAAGVARSLNLIVAAMVGYLASIMLLTLAVAPMTRAIHAADMTLRLACAAYLLFAAWKLWRERRVPEISAAPEPFRRVLTATALNPKAIVFAFVIVPFLRAGEIGAATPYLAALVAMIGLASGGWIVAGAAFRASGAIDSARARQLGAVVLCMFAIILSASTLWMNAGGADGEDRAVQLERVPIR